MAFMARLHIACADRACPTPAARTQSPSGMTTVSSMNQATTRNGATRLSTEAISCPVLENWRPGAPVVAPGPGQVRVWLVDLDLGLDPDEVETAEPGPELDVLSDDERARAARFVRARDRRRFARCRAALRQILGGILAEPPGSLRFEAAVKGKPELDRSSPAAMRSRTEPACASTYRIRQTWR